jgi:hypothetical protein
MKPRVGLLTIHLHDDEIEPHIVRYETRLILKFHTRCDLQSFLDFLKLALTESELQVFHDLWMDDSKQRNFEIEDGYVVIS